MGVGIIVAANGADKVPDFAGLAQLAEQLALNQRVRGSSPWSRISFYREDLR